MRFGQAMSESNRSTSLTILNRAAMFVGLLMAACFSLAVSADTMQGDAAGQTGVAPLFADDSPLAVTIEAPLTTLMKDRPEEEYLNGKFSFTRDDGMKQTVDLKIRTRGKYRRQEEHCDFAPIRLNFRKKQLIDTVFAGQDKLKMVTHCRTKTPYFEQLVLREYLAYRFLNVMTSKSYGVRLFQITYVDTEGAEPMTRLGFVIEDDGDVAARNGLISVGTGDISSDDLDHAQQNLVDVFQYLIGNTEYSLVRSEPGQDCCHNSDLMSATGEAPFTPLAYDFDFAGLVNAPYAAPNPRYRLRNVRQRLYKGLCRNNDLLPGTLQQFLDKKDAIYGLVENQVFLSSRSTRDVIRYLDTFYDRISQPKSVKTSFIDRCNEAP